MNKIKSFINVTIIPIVIGIAIAALINYKIKNNKSIKAREQAILEYYENTETLLDSLCINESDSIFNTNIGIKYLESKYKFDSLFIDNDRRN